MFLFTQVLSFIFGVFTFLQLGHQVVGDTQSANLFWINLSFLPLYGQIMVSVIGGLSLLGITFLRWHQKYIGLLLFGILPLFLGCLISTGLTYFVAPQEQTTLYKLLLPMCFLLGFVWIGFTMGWSLFFRSKIQTKIQIEMKTQNDKKTRVKLWKPLLIKLGLALILGMFIPMLQILLVGIQFQPKKVDIIVVFGARVYSNGQLSPVLENRVRTACQLYLQGYSNKLLFSGGPGEGTISEPEAMKNWALSLGVKGQDIFLDLNGFTTEETVKNTLLLAHQHHFQKIGVVSSFTHLARIQLLFAWAKESVDLLPAKGQKPILLVIQQLFRETYLLWNVYLGKRK